MARVIKFSKTIRNNWKKSLAGAAAVAYGISYCIESYETHELMRMYCLEAVKYGDEPISPFINPPTLTVILNPVANKRKAKKLFEKYCEPMLHLAGFAVTIIQTQSENHARNIITNLNTHNDVIVVAGGDGTLSDVVTGLMRKHQKNINAIQKTPIGILPLGQTNTVANTLFYGYEDYPQIRQLAEATMAIVRGNTKLVDVLEVDLLEKDAEHPLEPIFAVGAVQWGAWNDAQSRTDKYWYWGPLKKYVTFIFNGFKKDINWDCNGIIKYSDPCTGCSQCYEENKQQNISNKKWWQFFLPISKSEEKIDYSKILNENCGIVRESPITAAELHIKTRNTEIKHSESIPSVKVELGPNYVKYKEFVGEGWRRLTGEKTLISKSFHAKDIEIYPTNTKNTDKERMFYIDNEEFELKPVRLKLIPNAIKVFYNETEQKTQT